MPTRVLGSSRTAGEPRRGTAAQFPRLNENWDIGGVEFDTFNLGFQTVAG